MSAEFHLGRAGVYTFPKTILQPHLPSEVYMRTTYKIYNTPTRAQINQKFGQLHSSKPINKWIVIISGE